MKSFANDDHLPEENEAKIGHKIHTAVFNILLILI